MVLNPQALHIRYKRTRIKARRHRIDSTTGNRKLDRRLLLNGQQAVQEGKGVLSAGEAEEEAVVGADHAPLEDCLGDYFQELFGWWFCVY